MPLKISTHGPSHGKCTICGAQGKLTEDHTPPKGCKKPTQVEMFHITERLTSSPAKTGGLFSQNGVKYRTICGKCNNSMLGAKYDPPLITFVNDAASKLSSYGPLPNQLTISAQPQAIMRSLIGHMSAQGVDRYAEGPMTEAVRDYFLDESVSLPVGLRFFYWAYPFRPQIMMRDASYLYVPSGSPFTFWLLKFFPVAFMLTWDESPQFVCPVHSLHSLHSLDPWRDVPYATTAKLPLVIAPLLPELWPEAPSKDTVILVGKEAVVANNLKRNKA